MKFLNWFKVELIEVASAKQVKELEQKLKQQDYEIAMLKGEVKRLTMISSHLLDRKPDLYCYRRKRW